MPVVTGARYPPGAGAWPGTRGARALGMRTRRSSRVSDHLLLLRLFLPLLPLLLVAGPVRRAAARTPLPESEDRSALLVELVGAIGPASAEHVRRALGRAEEEGSPLVILRLDTPGGLSSSMREIVQAIVGAPAPVVVWVAPAGARAASAGTFLLYASHVAAMAPGTNVGAATPVPLGGGGGEEAGLDKATNDAAASIRALAALRGRNAEWGERAVREAATLSAREAEAENVIDLLAADLPGLLRALDGRRVQVAGREVALATTGLTIERHAPGWRVQVLQVLTDPNVALILLLLGVYGLVFEVASPGTFGPGILGGICLLLGLYALSVLPVSFAGVALLLLGLGCMAAEAFVPSFGVLGLGGLLAFAAGGLLLFDTRAPGFQVAWEVVAGAALVSAGLLVFGLRWVWRVQRSRPTTGSESLLGAPGRVLDWSGTRGHVRVAGDRWSATGPPGLVPDQRIVVVSVDGLRLVVGPTPLVTNGAPLGARGVAHE